MADGEPRSAGDGSLIVRTLRPLNLESPVSALDSWLTPNDQFFIRSHFGAPAVDLHPWELEISGLVDRPARLSLAGLHGRAQVTLPAVLQCSGNGRSLFRPGMPGVGWVRGAVGHAEWTGVRLADLLEEARLQTGAAHVHLIGGDAPPSPKTPAFIRSIPIDRALDPNTLLGLRMNGVPLPALHGGPLRLIVPGWAGNNWIKWVRRIVVAREEAPGFYMQTGYRIPRSPLPAGVTPKPEDLVPVTWLNVKSLITWPDRDAALRRASYGAGRGLDRPRARRPPSNSPPIETRAGGPRCLPPALDPEAGASSISTGSLRRPAATFYACAPPTRVARCSPRPPRGTRAAISGTASTRSPASCVRRMI